MIQISPNYEPAFISGADHLQHFDPYETDKYADSDFARILAGMLKEQELQNTKIPDTPSEEISLTAQNSEIISENVQDTEKISVSVQNNSIIFGITKQTEENVFSAENYTVDPINDAQIEVLGRDELINSSDIRINSRKELSAKRAGNEEEALKAAFIETESLSESDAAALSAAFSKISQDEKPGLQTGKAVQDASEKTVLAKAASTENLQQDSVNLLSTAANKEANSELINSDIKKNKPDESRAKDRKADRLSVEVRDFRSEKSGNELNNNSDLRVNAVTELKTADSGFKEISLELHMPNQAAKASAADAGWGTKAAFAFEDLLARELHQNFNNDIVRHASMILRDEGKGIIRLALKPDTLGSVKICLEMAENKIIGRIVVESEEALKAFRKEIEVLEQSFRESGYDDAYLQLSLAADYRGAQEFNQEAQARALLSEFDAASRYDTQEPADLYHTGAFFMDETTINVFA